MLEQKKDNFLNYDPTNFYMEKKSVYLIYIEDSLDKNACLKLILNLS